jgi:hypothetical protein
MKETVINHGREPLMLEDGTQLGAAHTPEARREGVTLSERDRARYVETGRLAVVEPPKTTVAAKPPATEEQTKGGSK